MATKNYKKKLKKSDNINILNWCTKLYFFRDIISFMIIMRQIKFNMADNMAEKIPNGR